MFGSVTRRLLLKKRSFFVWIGYVSAGGIRGIWVKQGDGADRGMIYRVNIHARKHIQHRGTRPSITTTCRCWLPCSYATMILTASILISPSITLSRHKVLFACHRIYDSPSWHIDILPHVISGWCYPLLRPTNTNRPVDIEFYSLSYCWSKHEDTSSAFSAFTQPAIRGRQ